METKKYKQVRKKNAPKVSEPHTIYYDVNALKLAGIDALMRIDNPAILEKAVKSLFKMAGQPFEKKIVAGEEDTIGKEEILAGIREGLLEIKERHSTGRKGMYLQELIDEVGLEGI